MNKKNRLQNQCAFLNSYQVITTRKTQKQYTMKRLRLASSNKYLEMSIMKT